MNATNTLAETIVDTGALTESAKSLAIEAMIQGRSNAPFLDDPGTGVNGSATYDTPEAAALSDEDAYAIAQSNARRPADYEGEAAYLSEKQSALAARLAEMRFDPITGTPSPILVGRPRENVERELAQVSNNLKIAVFSAREAAKYHEQQTALTERQVNEDALIYAWTGDSPERKAALDAVLLDIEARELAQKIHALRRS